jgi:hypothetical protein
MAASIGHETLFTCVDLLKFAPVPGLDVAGKILLSIWDAVELVEVSAMDTPFTALLVLTADLSIIDESPSVSAPDRTLCEHSDFYSWRDRRCRLHRSKGALCAHRETCQVRITPALIPAHFSYLICNTKGVRRSPELPHQAGPVSFS